MAQLNGLPVFKIVIEDSLESNTGIDFISLVDFPAIEQNWVAFSENEKRLFFSKDKQILAGPILIPDQPIYRYSEQMGEYYVTFSKEEIEKMVRKFQKTQKAINLNYQHKKDSQISNAVVQEIWITDSKDKSNRYGFNLPEGSAFVMAHIGDEKFWNDEVKSGNVKGFSIEGFLDMELKNIKKMNKEKFVSATTSEGLVIQSDSESFVVGAAVYTLEGETQNAVPDGTYSFDNGMTITVVEGVITEVTEPASEEPAMTAEEMSAIKQVLKPILDAYDAKIAELEVKLANVQAPVSVTEETDTKEEAKPSRYSIAMSAVDKLKQIKNTNKNK